MQNKRTIQVLMFAGIAMAIVSTGCRSMPGRNLFSFRSQPSAETLAGSGPTATYPAPPSATATPEAIDSIAGGTAAPSIGPVTKPATAPPGTGTQTTAQVSGIEVSPGYATPASSATPTNMAAAQANGIYGGTATTEAKPTAATSGYTFGNKALTPKADPATTPTTGAPTIGAATTGASTYAQNAAFAPPASSFQTPSTKLTPPASGYDLPSQVSATASEPANTAAGNPGGYTLPTDSAAIAAIGLPTKSPAEATTGGAASAADEIEIDPGAAGSPDFSTASSDSAIAAPASTVATPNDPLGSGGYTPGSTSTTHGYPTGDVQPSTSGSFYR